MSLATMPQNNQELEIIAGPCSIDRRNLEEVLRIGQKQINGIIPFTGVRVVGVKSRTAPTKSENGGGIDADMLVANQRLFAQRGISSRELHTHPSVEMMEQVLAETPVGVATEIVDPNIQCMVMANHFADKGIGRGRVMVWNPAVLQIGHPIQFMAQMAENFGWNVGIKNCKEQDGDAKKWSGILEYANAGMNGIGFQSRRISAIHRGYDIESKGTHRNQPIHENAISLKQKYPGMPILFDPSHAFGSDMRDQISAKTIEAMKMTMPDQDNVYVYDGILIEAGTSTTDTKQHLTLEELFQLTSKLADIRPIRGIKV